MNSEILRQSATSVLCGAVLVLGASLARADVTLTFDELMLREANGLRHSGVSFDLKVDGVGSPDAAYGVNGSDDLTFVDGQVLEGDAAALLTLDFDKPTAVLEFGVVLRSTSELAPGFTVELFDSDLRSIDIVAVVTRPLVSLSEARFRHRGEPVKRAVIDFNEAVASRFALDNLSFEGGTSSRFLRGDADGNGSVDISDAIRVLRASFGGSGVQLACADGADTDDSGAVNVSDAIYVLDYIFLGGNPPPAPFPDCESDPTPDDLSCAPDQTCAADAPEGGGASLPDWYCYRCRCCWLDR